MSTTNSLRAVLASSIKYQEKEYVSKLAKVMGKSKETSGIYLSLLKQQPSLKASFKGDLSESIKIPLYSDMTSMEWIKRSGDLKILSKSYGITSFLPLESEGVSYVSLSFGNATSGSSGGFAKLIAKNGSIIEADDRIWSPKVITKKSERGRKYASVFLIDCDYPVPEIRIKQQFCLWAKYNVSSSATDGSFFFEPECNDHIQYIPSHPSRGSSMHRVISVVIEHDKPILVDELKFLPSDSPLISSSIYKDSYLQKRFINLQSVLEEVQVNTSAPVKDIQLLGYQFYNTCWTKYVSTIFKKIRIEEPIFGEVLQSKIPIPSAYSVA